MSFTTLMYHEIRSKEMFNPDHPSHIDVKQDYDDVLPAMLFVTLDHFEEQMKYLHDNNFHTLTLTEVKDYYYQKKELPEKAVLLTFDDCYQSIKKYAYPTLKEYGFHAVAFVVTGWLHDAPREFNQDKSVNMAVSELQEMADVFEFANHTDLFHKRSDETTSLLMTCSDEELSKDLDNCNSNKIIQDKDVFAYPFGLFAKQNISLLKKKEFLLAFTSDPGKNDESTNPLLLYRNAVPYFISLEEFKKVVN